MDIDIQLSSLFVEFYNKKKKDGIVFIPDTKVSKIIMIKLYEQFINEGILTPIEQLSLEEKNGLVNECRQMKDIFYTNESLITNSKTLHVINLINNNS